MFFRPRACCTLLILLLFSAGATLRAAEPVELDVVTFNVLVSLGSKPGVPAWPKRRDLCIDVLRKVDPDLLGLQEPLPAQLEFFQEQLPAYDAVYYRKESGSSYPDAALLYKREVFEKLDEGSWWLSPTPERVSTGFGNALPRILVWARLKHLPSGRELFVFNTHFDNSQPSQERMAELCEQQFKPFMEQQLPMIFMGDFNTSQTRGDYPRLTSNGWRDAYTASPLASEEGRDDNVPTMFGGNGRIDHIFYHGDALEAVDWQRLESPDPERPLSDHYPVFARLRWE